MSQRFGPTFDRIQLDAAGTPFTDTIHCLVSGYREPAVAVAYLLCVIPTL
jgi:hypothetical protein